MAFVTAIAVVGEVVFLCAYTRLLANTVLREDELGFPLLTTTINSTSCVLPKGDVVDTPANKPTQFVALGVPLPSSVSVFAVLSIACHVSLAPAKT